MKPAFQREGEEIYLLDLEVEVNGIPQGQVIDVQRGMISPSMGLHSILRRGYWQDYTGTTSAEDLLLQTVTSRHRSKN